jgi:hypothetical protein
MLSSLSTVTQTNNQFVIYLARGVRAKSLTASLAIGMALNKKAMLPVSSLSMSSIGEYFDNTYFIDLRSKLSKLNDIVLIDDAEIMKYAKKFYVNRYHYCYADGPLVTNYTGVPILEVMDISEHLSEVEIKIINENYPEFIKIHNGFLDFIK